jgi:sigma-B regulation protein RsbU (phosphoserine phosphatase)
VRYGRNRLASALAIAVLAAAGLVGAWSQSSYKIDLTTLDAYVRPGFSLEWSYYEPDPADPAWIKVPAKPGNRPLVIKDLPIPGKPSLSPFALTAGRAQKYCIMMVFEVAPALLDTSTGVGLYLEQVGKNWEVYLNGSAIQSEVYLDRRGGIERERTIHGALVDVDKRFLKPGKNILSFVIMGDAADERTGLFAPGPYLIGDYQELQKLKSEYLDLMLIGISFFFGLYHLILFALRSANRQYLYYGLGSLMYAFFLFARSYTVCNFVADTALARGVELASLFLAVPLFLAFFDTTNRGKVTPFTIAIGVIGMLFALVAPFLWSRVIYQAWTAAVPLMILCLGVADVVLPVAAALRDKSKGDLGGRFRALAASREFRTIVLAVLVIACAAVFAILGVDVPAYYRAAKTIAFVLIFAMATVLASQFTGLFKAVGELTSGLEENVKERTSVLEGVMEEQSALNANLQQANQKLQDTMDIAAKDMKIAVQVQQGIFPQVPPELADWDIAFMSQPVSGVSGDFYDLYIEEGRLKGLVLGDVSGHGISSGLITVLARSIFWRCFHDLPAYSLGRITEDIHTELAAELSSVENYLTAIMLRMEGDTVEYVNAGHTDLAFRRAGKARASFLVPSGAADFKGPPLGREGISAPYRSVKFAVAPGDSLLLYTDCLIDARDEGGVPFGTEGLISAYGRAPADSAADMLEYIVDDWNFHLGGAEVADDLTILILKRKA